MRRAWIYGDCEKLPAADVIQLLTEYEKRLVPVIQRHGGSIDKFMGDGIMSTFGAVVPTRTFAEDALRAVDDLVDCAAEWAAERRAQGRQALTINFAVAQGAVVFGAVGDDTGLEYTVIGDAVNLSAKLEKHNKETGTIALATNACLELEVGQGYQPNRELRQLSNSEIVGFSDHVDLAPIDLVILAPGRDDAAQATRTSADGKVVYL